LDEETSGRILGAENGLNARATSLPIVAISMVPPSE